jgi:hypothetical protein
MPMCLCTSMRMSVPWHVYVKKKNVRVPRSRCFALWCLVCARCFGLLLCGCEACVGVGGLIRQWSRCRCRLRHRALHHRWCRHCSLMLLHLHLHQSQRQRQRIQRSFQLSPIRSPLFSFLCSSSASTFSLCMWCIL